jgi:hypothetical protein
VDLSVEVRGDVARVRAHSAFGRAALIALGTAPCTDELLPSSLIVDTDELVARLPAWGLRTWTVHGGK